MVSAASLKSAGSLESVGSSNSQESILSYQPIIKAVKVLAEAARASQAFNFVISQANQPNFLNLLINFFNNEKLKNELSSIFIGDDLEKQSPVVRSLLQLSDLNVQGEVNELSSLPGIANSYLQEFLSKKISPLGLQLGKVFKDAEKHNFSSSFKAYLICRGLRQFFLKLSPFVQRTAVGLNSNFYIATAFAEHVEKFMGCDFFSSDDVNSYAENCFSSDFGSNNFSVRLTKKQKSSNSFGVSNLLEIKEPELLPFVLSSIAVFVSGFESLGEKIKASDALSSVLKSCHLFLGEDFSDLWSLASVDVYSNCYVNAGSQFSRAKIQSFDGLMQELNSPKKLDCGGEGFQLINLKGGDLCQQMSAPNFYPMFFSSAINKIIEDQGLTKLDSEIFESASQKIANDDPGLWVNAMLGTGLVGLDCNKIDLNAGAWYCNGEGGYSFEFVFFDKEFNDGEIGMFSNHLEAFLERFTNLIFVCQSPSVFDFSSERFDWMEKGEFSLLVVASGKKQKLSLSPQLINVIMEVFQSIPVAKKVVNCVVASLESTSLQLRAHSSYLKVVNGFEYIQPEEIDFKGSKAYKVDLGFVSEGLKEKMRTTTDICLFEPKLVIELILNKKPIVLGPSSSENIAVFFKENTLDFRIVDRSDPNDPTPYAFKLEEIPDAFFEKLVRYPNVYPIFRDYPLVDGPLLKVLLTPCKPLNHETENSDLGEIAEFPPFIAQAEDKFIQERLSSLSEQSREVLLDLLPLDQQERVRALALKRKRGNPG